MACCWFCTSVETRRPEAERARAGRAAVRPRSSGNEPRSGTPKPKTVTAVTRNIWKRPMRAKGSELADEQLPRPDRRHDDLLHGADLLLAHDPHRREQHGHDHQDHGQHGGHVEPAALEVGVVEDARARARPGPAARERPAPARAQPALPAPRRRSSRARARGVAERDAGGGGVAAVRDQLDRGRCGRRRAAAPKPGPITSPSWAREVTSQRSTSAARSSVPTTSK